MNIITDTLFKKLKKYNINYAFLEKLEKNLSDYDLEFINPATIDIHSHLLPGIDDGARTMEEAISLIKALKDLGYTKLITTPHIISDSYPNTKKIIEKKLSEVKKAIKKEGIDIEIEAGAEHYVDMDFLDLLENDEVIPFFGKYLLFETSYTSKPIILEEAIFSMQTKGYIPVMAHPERYQYMHFDIDAYKQLKDLGVLFQINIKSLRDTSSSIYNMALMLIESGLVDFVGSDVHRKRDTDKLEKFLKRKDYKSIFEYNKILNISELG